ncbi:MAG: response regulator [Chloroflexaceae bacterium]|nr:response regulator [Chloroflexaceae bacterium]
MPFIQEQGPGVIEHARGDAETSGRCEGYARRVLNALPDLVTLHTRDGTCQYCNNGLEGETIFPGEDDLVGKKIDDVLPAEVAQPAMQSIRQALNTGEMQVLEYQVLLEDTMRDYEMRLVACGDDMVLAITRDITERKKSERLKNEFVSIVSHELRTPLTSIRGSLSLITGRMAHELSPKIKGMVDIAYKNSERLVSLVNDILDIDKIESGKMIFDLKPMELMPLVEHALETNHAYAEPFGVTFALTHSLPGARVHVDEDRLMQVLANLLSNATKFSPRGGTVEASVTRHEENLRVAVSDQGPGIPEEFRARIFQKFAQADSSATRQKGGTGLGLSISKAIIERHGGKIGFASNSSSGATFFFDIPEWREREEVYGGSQHRPRILICEDTPDLASMLSIMLNYNGFNTDIAYNTIQARQFLETNQYAAMTLDLIMPGQGGIDFIRELRSQERTRHLPIVVISAIAQQGRQELEGGAFEVADWLDKTIDYQDLVAAIRRAISRKRVERPRILHVEDDVDVFEVISTMLHDMADTFHARGLQEAKSRLEREMFNLIILDLSLPDGSGLDLLPILYNPSRPPVPVIIFSAREVNRETAQKVVAVLVKSRTTNQELVETIKSQIGT